MNTKALSITNLIGVIAVIFFNYYLNAKGINGNTAGSLSEEYANLFTPAGYAFAIWGIIFLALLVQAIFLVARAFKPKKNQAPITQIGLGIFLANLLNISWLLAWLNEYTGISVVVMILLLITLLSVIVRTNMERWDAPLKIITFIWWPICLYSGWIAVATIANIAALLAKIGWTGGIAESTWTIIMIAVATLLGIFMILTRNMREFSMVIVWGLIAIAVRHWGEIPLLQYSALAGTGVLLVVSSYHASQNMATMPFKKKWNEEEDVVSD